MAAQDWNRLLIAAALLPSACGAPPELQVDKPAPPDMSALVAAYEHPTGSLDAATVTSAEPLARTRAGLAVSADVYARVRDGLSGARDAYASEHPSSGSEPAFEAAGYLRVVRICSGWADTPSPDPSNGTLSLTIGFTQAGIDPVVWGGAEQCRYRVGTSQILLSNTSGAGSGIRAYVGTALSFTALLSAPAILDVGLDLTIDAGAVQHAVYDLRVGNTIELRVPGTNGDVIASVISGQLISFRAANGTFTCDLTAKTCTSDTGISFSF